jgi:predicted nuclease with TOPRIM domain
MAEDNQSQEIPVEEVVKMANDALMKNRQLQGMVNDLGDKVKSREIENSSLRTTIGMLQEEIAALRGEASASEEE